MSQDKAQEPTMAQFDPQLAEAFDQLQYPDLPSIQEDRFVREFLPMFANRDGNKVNLHAWLDIAGHPHLPVAVMRGQQMVCMVPPLLRDAGMVAGDRSKGQSIYENIITAEKKRTILPALGEAHLRETIIDRVKHEMASLNYAKAWNQIFKAYGFPEIELPDEAKAVIDETEVKAAAAAPIDPNDEIDDFREL